MESVSNADKLAEIKQRVKLLRLSGISSIRAKDHYSDVEFLLSEIDRVQQERDKLQEELDFFKESMKDKTRDYIASIESIQQEKDKAVGGLRWYAQGNHACYEPDAGVTLAHDEGKYARTILREIGVREERT